MAAYILTDVQKVRVAVSFVDAVGNPAVVDGAPAWFSTDITILDVAPEPDGMAATVTAVGALGQAQVQVQADADVGAGVVTIMGTLDVQVVGSIAVSAQLMPGTPEPK